MTPPQVSNFVNRFYGGGKLGLVLSGRELMPVTMALRFSTSVETDWGGKSLSVLVEITDVRCGVLLYHFQKMACLDKIQKTSAWIIKVIRVISEQIISNPSYPSMGASSSKLRHSTLSASLTMGGLSGFFSRLDD
ncbi:hypothetical protein Tco_0305430 [Tanacetum coccineum]